MLERLKTHPDRVAEDMTLIKAELDSDPTATVRFGTDGKPLFSSKTRSDMPGEVVASARSTAGGAKSKLDGYEFADALARDHAVNRVKSEVTKKVEDTYAEAIKSGDSHDVALGKAKKALCANVLETADPVVFTVEGQLGLSHDAEHVCQEVCRCRSARGHGICGPGGCPLGRAGESHVARASEAPVVHG